MLLVMVFLYVLANLMTFVTAIVAVDGADECLNDVCKEIATELGGSETLAFAIFLMVCCVVFIPALAYYSIRK